VNSFTAGHGRAILINASILGLPIQRWPQSLTTAMLNVQSDPVRQYALGGDAVVQYGQPYAKRADLCARPWSTSLHTRFGRLASFM
jgi:hypothetical protein